MEHFSVSGFELINISEVQLHQAELGLVDLPFDDSFEDNWIAYLLSGQKGLFQTLVATSLTTLRFKALSHFFALKFI
jgi:hypothetical protein